MAIFNGTLEEFNKYLGPHMRNLIQTSVARKYRSDVGKCEICGTKKGLQAAHKHGKDRVDLIKEAAKPYIAGNDIVNGDLQTIEAKFKDLHQPAEETFYILCGKCHKNYDRTPTTSFDELKIQYEIIKVENRFPDWLEKPNQQNTVLINTFFQIQKDFVTTIEMLKEKALDLNNFDSTLRNLSFIGTNNYGKVFEIDGDHIHLWEEVSDYIIEQYNKSNE